MRHSLVMAALAMLLPAVPASATSLLINGGFESAPVGVTLVGNFYAPNGMVQQYPAPAITSQYLAGWTIATPGESNLQRNPYVNYSLYPTNSFEGSQFFSLNWSPLGGVTLDNSITQSFTLGAAANIDFSVAMATESGFAGSTLQATIFGAGNVVAAQSALFTNGLGNAAWDQKSWTFTLAAGTYTLALHGVGAGNAWDVLIDDVRLDATAAVPEPASWAMMIGGFALIGAAMRRRLHAVQPGTI